MVFAYFKMERVIALNVNTINFFCLLHLVEVSTELSECKGLLCYSDRDVYICYAIVIVKMSVLGQE